MGRNGAVILNDRDEGSERLEEEEKQEDAAKIRGQLQLQEKIWLRTIFFTRGHFEAELSR